MTEQEQKAIKWMKNVRDDAVVTLDHIAKEEPNVSPMLYAGRKEKAETIIKGFEELEQYRAIGTPDECRAAVEKQKAKKPVEMKPTDKLLNGYFLCPICGGLVGMDEYSNKYCGCCGQKLDWGDVE